MGDTIRISLSTFHAEEEVKVAWEILKALKLRERGPVLIACPTCGRLQFDMDTVVAEIEERLRQYDDPIEVAVLGCAVNGIGEASHADFGITGAKNEGLIFAHGKPLRKVPQDELVDELFVEIDKSIDRGRVVVDERKAAEGAAWLEQIEEENAGELTPERIAAMEAAAAADEALADGAGAADGRRAEGQADRAGRGRLADRGAPLHPRLAARRRRGGRGLRSAERAGGKQRLRCTAVVPGAHRSERGTDRSPQRPMADLDRLGRGMTGHGLPRVRSRHGPRRSLAITSQNASTTIGSNCVPAQRRSSAMRLVVGHRLRGRGGRWSSRRRRRRRPRPGRRAGSRRPRSPSG